MLCGVSPIEASSGRTVRHRLNRRWQPPSQYGPVPHRGGPPGLASPTRDYLARRTTEGLTKREIIRCLKRYVAREGFTALQAPTTLTQTA